MNDFYMQASFSRDDFADALSGNPEQAGYVLARFAEMTACTVARDDLLDSIEGHLSEEQADALSNLCRSMLDRLSSREASHG